LIEAKSTTMAGVSRLGPNNKSQVYDFDFLQKEKEKQQT